MLSFKYRLLSLVEPHFIYANIKMKMEERESEMQLEVEGGEVIKSDRRVKKKQNRLVNLVSGY